MSALSKHAPHNLGKLGSIWSSIPSYHRHLTSHSPPSPSASLHSPQIQHALEQASAAGRWDGQDDMQAVVHDLNQEREDVDVDMVDVSELAFGDEMIDTSAMQGQDSFLLALDTNIFISHLSTVKSLHSRLLSSSLPIRLLIPNTVISELDRHKNRYSPMQTVTLPAKPGGNGQGSIHNPENRLRRVALGTVAREAVEWLLDVGRTQRANGDTKMIVRFQKWDEMESAMQLPKADDRILDCCQYFTLSHSSRVFLWTDDRNLALQAEANGIPSFGNKDFSLEEILSFMCYNDSAADPSESWSCSTSDRTVGGLRIPSKKPSVSSGWEAKSNLLADSVAVLKSSNHHGKTLPVDFPPDRKSARPIKAPHPEQRIITEQNAALNAFLARPQITTLLLALVEAIALPIYSALLHLVADGDPVRLRRSVLGKDDPGPSQWTFDRCCELMIQHWDAFRLLYGASTSEQSAFDSMDIDMKNSSKTPYMHQARNVTAFYDLTTSITAISADKGSPEQWLASLKTRQPSSSDASSIAHAEQGLQHLWDISHNLTLSQKLPPLTDRAMNRMTTTAISFLFLGPPRFDTNGIQPNEPYDWWLDEENRVCIHTIIRCLDTLNIAS